MVIEEIHVTDADASVGDVNHLKSVLNKVKANTTVYADKGYDSQDNRALLEERALKDGIMRKAKRNTPLSQQDIERNKRLAKIRYRVEQSFAILHNSLRSCGHFI